MALLSLYIEYIISTKTTDQVGKDFRDYIQSDLNLEMEKLRLRQKNLIQVNQPISSGAETPS